MLDTLMFIEPRADNPSGVSRDNCVTRHVVSDYGPSRDNSTSAYLNIT